MSEPVKTDGIEDVLSSIRRLVSEDSRGAAVPPAASPQTRPDALVLTPALRVPEQEPPALHAEPPVRPVRPQRSEMAEAAGNERLHFVRTAEDTAVADATAAEAEPEPASEDAAPWVKPDATLFSAVGGVSEQAVSSSSLEEKIAALEAVIGGTDDQWEPDGESRDDYSGTNVEPLTWEDAVPEPGDAPGAEDAAQDDDGPEEVLVDADFLAREAVTEEALETLASDEAVLDEDSLRELVADIVREELQGALGERITRNVRKLVRREIHRALAAQDLG